MIIAVRSESGLNGLNVATGRTFNRIGQVLANRLKPCEQVERGEAVSSGSTTPVTSFFVLFSLCLLHFVEFAGMRFAQCFRW